MTRELGELIDQYQDRFGEGFPLCHTSLERAEKDIKTCLEKNITANKLDPDLYGANLGKDI